MSAKCLSRVSVPLGAAHAHPLRGDDEELVELVSVVGEDVAEPLDLGSQPGGGQAKENDASVRLLQPNHQLTEVAVVGDEDAPLGAGDGEYLAISKRGGIVAGDGLGIVPHAHQVGC